MKVEFLTFIFRFFHNLSYLILSVFIFFYALIFLSKAEFVLFRDI